MHKRKTPPSAPRERFALTAPLVGAAGGMIIGLIVEMITRRSLVVMQVGGLIGITAGAVVESVRLWWRRYSDRKLHRKTGQPIHQRR